MANEPDSFEMIVREHQSMVFRTLLRMTGGGEQIKDLAQEVFLRLYRALPHFRRDAKISTYLYRIVLNVARDEWKRRQKERANLIPMMDAEESWEERLAHPGRNPEQLLLVKQTQAVVESAFMELSEPERAVLVLCCQEECTYEEAALILNLPIGTVRTHLHRGRQRLKEKVRERLNRCAINK